MGKAKNVHVLYRDSMRTHGLGYAMYEPAPFKDLQPGRIGYLDEYQRWHTILDLTDTERLQHEGYLPTSSLQKSDHDIRSWGPRESSNVSRTDIKFETEAGSLVAALPVDCDFKFQYSTSTDFGAVLMCDDKVVAEGFDHRQPFLDWIKTNAKAILQRCPDVKEYGVTAVTWTYSASDIHINAWQDPQTRVVLGLKAGVDGIGGVGPETSWIRKQHSTGWESYNDQKRVVFFTGVKVRFRWFGQKQERESHWRGASDNFVAELGEGEVAEAEVEYFGENWEDIEDDGEETEDLDVRNSGMKDERVQERETRWEAALSKVVRWLKSFKR